MIPFHPLADLFPLIEGAEFEALVADVAAQGLRQKILLREGKILDGRNRYRALVRAGLVGGALGARAAAEKHPKFFTSCDDLSDAAAARRVVSLNVARRHLTESQRALIAAKLAGMGRGRPQKARPEKSANLQNIGAVAGDASGLPAGDLERAAPALAVADRAQCEAELAALWSGACSVDFEQAAAQDWLDETRQAALAYAQDFSEAAP